VTGAPAALLNEVNTMLIERLDRRRFDVMIANLVGNALRHGGPPVTVTARAEPHGSGEGRLVLEVRDHGPGLPEAAIPHLFDRFYKADTARARSEGSGLGLAIASENAQLHGGHIEAGNYPDGGAVFTVTVPLKRVLPDHRNGAATIARCTVTHHRQAPTRAVLPRASATA
jgi:signal transduction histidine kinase